MEHIMSEEVKEPRGLKLDGSSYKVLIVDDSIFVQKQLRQILTSEQFDIIDAASDGTEGVEKYKQHQNEIDVVTLDITMPNMDGITALEHIMKVNPKAKVIMISALGKEELVKQALVAGAKNYIVKPLDREKVLSRIHAVVSR
ncbi:MAG: response regulator [Spirochaetales bacterium]|nr:response regulator [Spirochaetales bacterium]MBR6061894.1 response regulator [Spirochaetales bacterium]MBR6199835.1 response regulator [Spirochaetales bacterium]